MRGSRAVRTIRTIVHRGVSLGIPTVGTGTSSGSTGGRMFCMRTNLSLRGRDLPQLRL